ncbi:cocaine- and amphetamine-regulated transcript protein [Pleuronectes platessa]|uniref:cocaine- and amphetamine-regulated transcript protein n=1 Tax=Pleuronectes platessa TaxID=8262 RepID=UPI00232A1F1F|nr:cocaine- and amphetamine-regulated transcript protein [Pleuronectes platessa]
MYIPSLLTLPQYPEDGLTCPASLSVLHPIEALQEVLEKLKSKQLPSTEKKLGWPPSWDAGEQCALRKGWRIGKLCGCPRGSFCNFKVLKCLKSQTLTSFKIKAGF